MVIIRTNAVAASIQAVSPVSTWVTCAITGAPIRHPPVSQRRCPPRRCGCGPPGRAAVGLDPVELSSMALDPGHGHAAHLRAIERLEHVVRALGTDDADHQLHDGPLSEDETTAPLLRGRTYIGG